LEFACEPDAAEEAGFPLLSLAPELEPEVTTQWAPSAMLGEAWEDPSALPQHLQGAEALVWLSALVGRLVESKSSGREEMCYLLDLPAPSFPRGFGGAGVPLSITPEQAGALFEELTFVPDGTTCHIEGCNTNAHLNGKVGTLSAFCPDGQQYAKVNLGELGELQLHRKNLRLPAAEKPAAQAIDSGEAAPEGLSAAPPSAGRTSNESGETSSEGIRVEVTMSPGSKSKEDVQADNSSSIWSWWPFNAFCCGSAGHRCCKGGKAPSLAVVQDDFQNYSTHDSDMVQSDLHPSFGADQSGDSFADELGKLAKLKVAGDINQSDFQIVKERLLANMADGRRLAEELRRMSQFKSSGEVTQAEFEAAKRQLLQPQATGQGKPIAAELTKLLSLRKEGFLTDTEFAMAKSKLLG